MTRTDSIARIRIELNGIDPTIWRRVEVPLTTSLKGLHDVIQAVMPFENRHLFLFNVGDKRYGLPDREWDHVHETLDAKISSSVPWSSAGSALSRTPTTSATTGGIP
jgi:pRiA4b ORF-3-like protein